ncbi:hypothetical protein [Denitromonas sp.]|uniref:hypothetical protein n=1 Tax=Denitromonas sp. TaxID=2734609 RepID=UPI002FDEDFF7
MDDTDIDAATLSEIDLAFGHIEKPEHFTDVTHCEECAEHDELLRTRNRETLSASDVENPGWDPFCFSSANGLAYYFPTLARLALSKTDANPCGWYADQLLFHLYSGFTENAFFQFCSVVQRQAVAHFIAHMIETRPAHIDRNGSTDEFFRCHSLWSTAPDSAQENAPSTDVEPN